MLEGRSQVRADNHDMWVSKLGVVEAFVQPGQNFSLF